VRCASGVTPIQPGVNAANWMLDVSSPDAEKKGGHDFAELYRVSQLAAEVQATVTKFRCGCRRLCLLLCGKEGELGTARS
jgi:hypothetical protein